MSSDRVEQWVRDIVEQIDRIQRYVGDHDFAAFAEDEKTVDAVERCLQRITEAVIRIGPEQMTVISPSLPQHAARGLGNILRHEYDAIDARILWATITDRLPSLKHDCSAWLDSLDR